MKFIEENIKLVPDQNIKKFQILGMSVYLDYPFYRKFSLWFLDID